MHVFRYGLLQLFFFLNMYKHLTSLMPSGKKSQILALPSARNTSFSLFLITQLLSFDPCSCFCGRGQGRNVGTFKCLAVNLHAYSSLEKYF